MSKRCSRTQSRSLDPLKNLNYTECARMTISLNWCLFAEATHEAARSVLSRGEFTQNNRGSSNSRGLATSLSLSLVLEHCGAFFRESQHALTAILGRKRCMVQPSLCVKSLRKSSLNCVRKSPWCVDVGGQRHAHEE